MHRAAARGEWLARLLGRALAAYVRLVGTTSRIAGTVTGDQVVLAFWHEYNLAAAVVTWRVRRHGRRHVSFSTDTFRGIVMTALLNDLEAGSVPLPAEDDRVGAARLARDLARLGREGATVAVSPDGPVGPHRFAKPGALIVARESGLAIQPWAIAVRPPLRLAWRWDRHIVPLPFSRIRVFEGAPIAVEPRTRLRPLLVELQAGLDEVAARADAVPEPRRGVPHRRERR
jgi:lysophospholipid acyltransferase (LPLAT)-like uncharacterized protein